MYRIKILLLLIAAIPLTSKAQTEAGLDLSAGITHKFSKKFSATIDAGARTRNDFKTWDRVNVGVDAAFKVCKNFKVSGGYALLIDNNREKLNRNSLGELKNWRPTYWGLRHRFNVSLTGNVDIGRLNISLRERWQYTLRPGKDVTRYDFNDEEYETKYRSGKGKHVLRSRLKLLYNIRKCPVNPYASAEIYNAWALEKTRVTVGAEWNITKKHTLEAYYRYQIYRKEEDKYKPNMHYVGIGYNVKL